MKVDPKKVIKTKPRMIKETFMKGVSWFEIIFLFLAILFLLFIF